VAYAIDGNNILNLVAGVARPYINIVITHNGKNTILATAIDKEVGPNTRDALQFLENDDLQEFMARLSELNFWVERVIETDIPEIEKAQSITGIRVALTFSAMEENPGRFLLTVSIGARKGGYHNTVGVPVLWGPVEDFEYNVSKERMIEMVEFLSSY
jgi:hypothetical protein